MLRTDDRLLTLSRRARTWQAAAAAMAILDVVLAVVISYRAMGATASNSYVAEVKSALCPGTLLLSVDMNSKTVSLAPSSRDGTCAPEWSMRAKLKSIDAPACPRK